MRRHGQRPRKQRKANRFLAHSLDLQVAAIGTDAGVVNSDHPGLQGASLVTGKGIVDFTLHHQIVGHYTGCGTESEWPGQQMRVPCIF
jgi:hypothetical protein